MTASKLCNDERFPHFLELSDELKLIARPGDVQPIDFLALNGLVQSSRENHRVRVLRGRNGGRKATGIVTCGDICAKYVLDKESGIRGALNRTNEVRRDAEVVALQESGRICPRPDECKLADTVGEWEDAVVL